MSRLVVNPGTPNVWEIQLRPGVNSIGRSPGNDHQIDDPSVSGSHCQIVVTDSEVSLKDLGSTNGTYVNRAPVLEAVLQSGQVVNLGEVEMRFESDATPAAPPMRIRLAAVKSEPETPPDEPLPETPPPVAAPVALSAVPPVAAGAAFCKFHLKTPARFLCNKCRKYFCDLCVATREAEGGARKFCRSCGFECVPVLVKIARPHGAAGFFNRVPGAFLYPLRGSGVLGLIVGTILFGGLSTIRNYGLRIGGLLWLAFILMLWVIGTGYLFSYMQNIIHATVANDKEMPELPSMGDFWQDIILPCLQLVGLTLICFGPAIGVGWWMVSSQEPPTIILLISTIIIGVVYFPMAFLAVAMLDTVLAANPLQVIPSILRVPLEYLVTLIILAGVLLVRWLGDIALLALFPRGLATHSATKLFGYLGGQAFWSFTGLYLLTVGVHILGLLYLTKKDKLGWY